MIQAIRFFLIVGIALLLISISVNGCTPLSTVPFNPAEQVNVTKEINKQTGNELYDGMPCDEYCEITQSCNIRQRMNARMNPGLSCRVYSANSLRQAIRRRH